MREAPHVLGVVLAGGEGKRLYPLTADRAKPAVPFGGAYRLIDFVLSNLVNARYLRICVLTQYKSHSLDRHISQNWRLSGLAGEYITPVPAQQRHKGRVEEALMADLDRVPQFAPLHDLGPGAVGEPVAMACGESSRGLGVARQ